MTLCGFTRHIERNETGWGDVPVGTVMTTDPQTAEPDERGSGVVHRMEERGVMAVPVVNRTGILIGIVHLHDLMRAGAA